MRRVESILLQELDQLTLPLDESHEARVIPIARFQHPEASFSHRASQEADHESGEAIP